MVILIERSDRDEVDVEEFDELQRVRRVEVHRGAKRDGEREGEGKGVSEKTGKRCILFEGRV